MGRVPAMLMIALGLILARQGATGGEGNQHPPPDFVIDFSPLEKLDGMLDFKIKVICKSAMGEAFDRGVTVKGPATKTIADSVFITFRKLFEAHKWKIMEPKKNQLLVVDKGGSPVEKMEIRVEGLEKAFHPVMRPLKKSCQGMD